MQKLGFGIGFKHNNNANHVHFLSYIGDSQFGEWLDFISLQDLSSVPITNFTWLNMNAIRLKLCIIVTHLESSATSRDSLVSSRSV